MDKKYYLIRVKCRGQFAFIKLASEELTMDIFIQKGKRIDQIKYSELFMHQTFRYFSARFVCQAAHQLSYESNIRLPDARQR